MLDGLNNRLVLLCMNERNRENFVLDKAKNVGDAVASTRLFNAGQNKICRLQPFNVKQNKSNIYAH